MIMQKAKITTKRQITLPIRIMRKLGLNPGDAVAFREIEDHIAIEPVTQKASALDLIGQYPELSLKKITPKHIQKIRQQAFSQKAKPLS